MASAGRQDMSQNRGNATAVETPDDRQRDADLLSRLQRQNLALDHLRRALDFDEDDDGLARGPALIGLGI